MSDSLLDARIWAIWIGTSTASLDHAFGVRDHNFAAKYMEVA